MGGESASRLTVIVSTFWPTVSEVTATSKGKKVKVVDLYSVSS